MAHLTSAFAEARAASASLGDQIQTKITSLVSSLQSGAAIQSTSGNGQTVSFFDPGNGSHTQDSMLEMWQELSELYATKRAELFPNAWNLNNDWSIYAAMVADDSLYEAPRVSVRSFSTDFSTMRP